MIIMGFLEVFVGNMRLFKCIFLDWLNDLIIIKRVIISVDWKVIDLYFFFYRKLNLENNLFVDKLLI